MNSIFLLSENNFPIKEVHFNLWMVGDDPFIDIGLKLGKRQKLLLYLPWEDACVEDLYETIKDQDVLNAIFNQHIKLSTKDDDSYLTISRNNEKFDIVRACLNKKKLEIENTTHNNRYTQFVIEANSQAENIDVAYVRLRARGFENNVFCTEKKIGRLISPFREITEAIDFRINELRTLKPSNSEIRQKFTTTPKIEILHFFLVKDFGEINSLNSPNYDRCREFEDKAWDKYLPSRNVTKGAKLAYHWKKNRIEEREHFSILAIFKKKDTYWKSILSYFLALVFLNILSAKLFLHLFSS